MKTRYSNKINMLENTFQHGGKQIKTRNLFFSRTPRPLKEIGDIISFCDKQNELYGIYINTAVERASDGSEPVFSGSVRIRNDCRIRIRKRLNNFFVRNKRNLVQKSFLSCFRGGESLYSFLPERSGYETKRLAA